MPLELTERDRSFLAGEEGPGAKMAMSIVVRMGEVQDAERLLDITAAHIDSSLYMGQSTLDYATRLVELGARVRVPATLNVSGVEEHGWEKWAVPSDWARDARRQMEAYVRMGCRPTWTCAPYQTEERPVFGQHVAWGESSAIVFANSVLGARTERYPDLLDICAAITGRVPAVGLHLDRHRLGDVLIRLRDIPEPLQRNDGFYPVLGHLVGGRVGSRVPVIVGMGVTPSEDQLKALGAAMASSGAVALFHIVGVTPEAPDEGTAFGGVAPRTTIEVDLESLRAAWDDLSGASEGRLDMVVLGSPHFSLTEFRQLAALLVGRRRHPDVRFLVTTGRAVRAIAEEAGLLEPLRAFGGELMVDTCILTTPMLPPEIRVLMTNSAKFVYYTPGLLDRAMTFGSLADCVGSAEAGRVTRDESLWNG